MADDSIFGRRMELANLIKQGCVDERVLTSVIPNGIPVPDEDLLWDYKESFPCLSSSPSEDEKVTYAAKMAALAKDCVSFYNMYGGYLLAGITDTDLRLVGFEGEFDVNDLCKKIYGATRCSIDLKYRKVCLAVEGCTKTVGILFIPQRPKEADPVQFLKDAPKSQDGKKAYVANDLYMRSREECRKAVTASDFALLFNRVGIDLSLSFSESSIVENNLPARDPNLIKFVGREEQLDELWKWFIDKYTAVRLLSGPGGVGKTSIAWTFSEAVSRNPPPGLEKVVWLTAKKKTYAALLGDYIDISHTRFSDLTSLLLALLDELGVPDNQKPEDPSREELIEECISAVKAWPCLLVVDDIDSLPNDEQYEVFRTVSTIFDRVIATGVGRARALLTARLNLGAAPGQLMQIKGLPLDDFIKYTESAAQAINAPLAKGANGLAEIKQLHKASNGSPLFAASILRLRTH